MDINIFNLKGKKEFKIKEMYKKNNKDLFKNILFI